MEISLQRPAKEQPAGFLPPSPATRPLTRKILVKRKRIVRTRKRTVNTHFLSISFVVKFRSEVRARRPSVTHEELDSTARRITNCAPDWMFAEYSTSDDSSGNGRESDYSN
jgi:hypothetical protein